MDTINQQRGDHRNALIEFAMRRPRTHWVTLNTHRKLSDAWAMGLLKRWRVEIMRRVHGRRFFELLEADRLEFFGAPEHAAYGHPHFHLACAIPEKVASRFERHAAARWTAIVPSGTCHIEKINQTPEDHVRVVGYALKWLKSGQENSFVDSRLFEYQ
jgi:hypothetical protein